MRYKWNKKRFAKNMLSLVIILMFSFSMAACVMWGFDMEAKIQAAQTKRFLNK